MKYQILFGVGMSAMLAACSPSSSNSGSSSAGAPAAQARASDPVLLKADLAVVGSASSNSLFSDIASSGYTNSNASAQIPLVQKYVKGAGDFSTLEQDADSDCLNILNSGTFPFLSYSVKFQCSHVAGTLVVGPQTGNGIDGGTIIESNLQLTLSGTGDTAVLAHDTQFGPVLPFSFTSVISASRSVNDVLTINGVKYMVKEDSKFSHDLQTGIVTIEGQLAVQKDDIVSETFVMSGSADLRAGKCGMNAGSISYKGPNSDIEISFQGCNAMTVTANGDIVSQTVAPPPPVLTELPGGTIPGLPITMPNTPLIVIQDPSLVTSNSASN